MPFSKVKQKLSYRCIRLITFPIEFFPLSWIRKCGKALGFLLFYTSKRYRKRTLSNLSLASICSTEKELKSLAVKSLQNLAIIGLEYPKFSRTKDLSRFITCLNPEPADSLSKKGVGIIFFCGHQSNWEALFLDGTLRMKGAAIGKQTKNPFLYDWIISIREKNGGTIIEQKRALKEGLQYLKKGTFLGILGDQADPESSFSYPFFSRKAKTSLAPAILSYRSGAPILVATTKRTKIGYETSYSDPIWPDRSKSLKIEAKRMMKEALSLLESSIQTAPDEWLWQHNKYKQQNKIELFSPFRKEAILFVFDDSHKYLVDILPFLRKIYPDAFWFAWTPKSWKPFAKALHFEETLSYETSSDLYKKDYRPKLVFNFSKHSHIKKHFLSLSAFEVFSFEEIKKLSSSEDLKEVFAQALCKHPEKYLYD